MTRIGYLPPSGDQTVVGDHDLARRAAELGLNSPVPAAASRPRSPTTAGTPPTDWPPTSPQAHGTSWSASPPDDHDTDLEAFADGVLPLLREESDR